MISWYSHIWFYTQRKYCLALKLQTLLIPSFNEQYALLLLAFLIDSFRVDTIFPTFLKIFLGQFLTCTGTGQDECSIVFVCKWKRHICCSFYIVQICPVEKHVISQTVGEELSWTDLMKVGCCVCWFSYMSTNKE